MKIKDQIPYILVLEHTSFSVKRIGYSACTSCNRAHLLTIKERLSLNVDSIESAIMEALRFHGSLFCCSLRSWMCRWTEASSSVGSLAGRKFVMFQILVGPVFEGRVLPWGVLVLLAVTSGWSWSLLLLLFLNLFRSLLFQSPCSI